MTAPAPGLPEDVGSRFVYVEGRGILVDGVVEPFRVGDEILILARVRGVEGSDVTPVKAILLYAGCHAMRAATEGSGEASPAAGASAAHVAPPVPASFDAALAALDVEPVISLYDHVTQYDILGLDDVRAAHRAEVDRLAARLAEEIKWGHARCTPEVCQSSGVDCPAAIRARGVANPRTDGEAATRSGEGAKS